MPQTPDHAEHSHHELQLPMDLRRLAAQSRAAASRRRALGWLAGGAVWGLSACGGGSDNTATESNGGDTGGSGSTGSDTGSDTGSTGSGSDTGSGSTNTSCSLIPEETAGPYPGDGSNTANGSIANALALSGIVRSDIRSSIAGASGVATGVPLTVQLRLLNTNGSCASLAGYAIYLWHCDAAGRYSMYSSGVTAENYLRGVQVTGDDGIVSFVTIFPGCYSGRMPHLHFEIYRSTTTATNFNNKLRTSQLALARDVCSEVYNNTAAYSASIRNLAAITFASDNVFSDGVSTQLATTSGSLSAGYVATLDVGISV